MIESKTNPLVGVFRHSPSANVGRLGLKGIISSKSSSPAPVISQLQISKEKRITPNPPSLSRLHTTKETSGVSLPGRSFLTSWKQIPQIKYASASSLESQQEQQKRQETTVPRRLPSSSSSSSTLDSHPHEDLSAPVCSICIEPYTDGDQIKTLACSHSFHSECIGKWFFQSCCLDNSNNKDECSSFNCPECRQDHFRRQTDCETKQLPVNYEDSDVGSVSASSCANQIPGGSFLSMGNFLLESTYDFMSDFDVVTRTDSSSDRAEEANEYTMAESHQELSEGKPSVLGKYCDFRDSKLLVSVRTIDNEAIHSSFEVVVPEAPLLANSLKILGESDYSSCDSFVA